MVQGLIMGEFRETAVPNIRGTCDSIQDGQENECDPRQPMDVYDPGCLQT